MCVSCVSRVRCVCSTRVLRVRVRMCVLCGQADSLYRLLLWVMCFSPLFFPPVFFPLFFSPLFCFCGYCALFEQIDFSYRLLDLGVQGEFE